MIKFGEHEPLIEKTTVEREFVVCQCGEHLWVDEKRPIVGMELTIMCKKCERFYAPISYFRTGWDSCYILLGYLCEMCSATVPKLYEDGREAKAEFCEDCLRKKMKEMSDTIPDLQASLTFAKEQLEEEDDTDVGQTTEDNDN